MSERGVFAIARGIFDHPLFKPEPFTEREAWMWLIENAVWQATRARAGKTMIELKRGQLAYATRFLATKWKWKSEARVRRFLERLKNDAMIEVLATHETTRITICNYDKWQFGRRTDDVEIDAKPDAAATQQRRKEEESKKDNKEEVKEDSSLRSVDDFPPDYRERFWKDYPRKAGKAAAIRKLEAIRRSGKVTFAALMAGVHRYASACLQIETQFQKHPATWLNAGCWDDDAAALQRSTGPPRVIGPQGFESLFQQPERPPDEIAPRSEYDLDLAANTGH